MLLPPVPDVECHLLTLYDKETNSKESAFLTFTYVLGNVCRAIQACQNQSSEDLLNSTCNPFCPLICAFLSIYTQPSAFSSKLVNLYFFFIFPPGENNLLPGKKKKEYFFHSSPLNRREKGSKTAHVQSSLFSESLQNIILIFFLNWWPDC